MEKGVRRGKYIPLTAGQIRPEGWLTRQLRIQADGLSGHLDIIWPDIKESKWIGGDKEGWERVPYWLDGFIPLAYLLDDEELKIRAKRYVDAILENQEPDGWICPCAQEERNHYDVWAAFLIGKVLVMYYDCTGDERIEDAVYRMMNQLMRHISSCTLFGWGASRWYECLIPLLWLYQRRPEEWILDMVVLLEAEGLDYEKLYRNFDFKRPTAKHYWTQINHVVNTAMALKCRALMSYVTGEDPNAFAHQMYEKVMRHNSMVTGHFTGDECLSGDSPIQGSECCGIAEAMYSCEVLLAAGGDCFWGDLLEREAFNSLPAATTADMWAHQYVQMTNQISAKRIPDEAIPFNSNSGEANMFGLEPNYGCCTANFNQAWPKFVISGIMESEDGLVVNTLAPVSAQITIKGVPVTIKIKSEYPFRDEALVEVSADCPVEFGLEIRIPGFAKAATVDGKKAEPGEYYSLCKIWEGTSVVSVRPEFEAELVDRPGGLKALVRGPLVYALPVKAKVSRLEFIRDGVERKYPYCDYEMIPDSAWNYAFSSEDFEVVCGKIGEYPFSPENPPVKIKAKMALIPWEEKGGVCSAYPDSLVPQSDVEEIWLQPYGCTDLRMTEMPLVGKKKIYEYSG